MFLFAGEECVSQLVGAPRAHRMERMQRYHAELRIMQRHWREGMRIGKALAAGYYRKRDAYDCGNSRCGVCHPEKRFGHTATRQERVATLRMGEQMEA